MKRALFLSILFGMLGSLHAQGVFTLLHNGQSSFFYQPGATLSDIITNNAQDGDTIILPGGEVGPYGGIGINRRLTLIGAGVYPAGAPVTNITTLSAGAPTNNTFGIGAAASGSRFEGIKFTRKILFASGVTDIMFSRCDIVPEITYQSTNYNPPTGLIFSQCILRGGMTFMSGIGLTMTNCIFRGSLSLGTASSSGLINQCVFLNSNVSSNNYNPGIIYTNCAFVSTSTSGMAINNASTYDHCLFAPTNGQVTFGSAPVLIGGAIGQTTTISPTGLFADVNAVDAFNYDYDYSPASGSDLLGNGVDNQNIGLYGPGTTGWKDMAIPSNPHWTQFTPNGNINTTGGTIQVHIAAEAQQN